ncbi:MAG: hypothetical protein AAFW84_22120, partial [Cyanobacteria bacterium J06635_15]
MEKIDLLQSSDTFASGTITDVASGTLSTSGGSGLNLPFVHHEGVGQSSFDKLGDLESTTQGYLLGKGIDELIDLSGSGSLFSTQELLVGNNLLKGDLSTKSGIGNHNGDSLLGDPGNQPIAGQILKDTLTGNTTAEGDVVIDYFTQAKVLWENRATNFTKRDLANTLQKEGANAKKIAQAFNFGLGFQLETIADALDEGTSFSYPNIAEALWSSGHAITARKLADLLWDEGASQADIGQAMKYLDFGLTTIADAMDDGVTKSDGTGLNYTSVATALWNSGHKLDTRKLADLLWDEGASQAEIGQAMKYLDFGLTTIADAIDDGVTLSNGKTLNYTDTAIALWNSGHKLNTHKLADLLWDEGASQAEIGQAMKYLDFGLTTIADAIDDGVTKSDGKTLNYTDTAIALWNSGHKLDTRKLADLLWDEGASQAEIGQAMKQLGFGLTTIADAIDDGVTKSDG